MVGSPVLAEGQQVLECAWQDNKTNRGWLPLESIVVHESGADTAAVHDPIIYYFNSEKPIEGTVTTDTDAKFVVTWALKEVADTGESVLWRYRLVSWKNNNTGQISARLAGYGNHPISIGTCKYR